MVEPVAVEDLRTRAVTVAADLAAIKQQALDRVAVEWSARTTGVPDGLRLAIEAAIAAGAKAPEIGEQIAKRHANSYAWLNRKGFDL